MMTDEERRELCTHLRRAADNSMYHRRVCAEAADELERLAEELQYQYACDKAQQKEIERLAVEVAHLTTIMSGNVRLVEELEDGAIFEVGARSKK